MTTFSCRSKCTLEIIIFIKNKNKIFLINERASLCRYIYPSFLDILDPHTQSKLKINRQKIFLLLFLTLANLLLNFELRIVSRERERGDKREEKE